MTYDGKQYKSNEPELLRDLPGVGPIRAHYMLIKSLNNENIIDLDQIKKLGKDYGPLEDKTEFMFCKDDSWNIDKYSAVIKNNLLEVQLGKYRDELTLKNAPSGVNLEELLVDQVIIRPMTEANDKITLKYTNPDIKFVDITHILKQNIMNLDIDFSVVPKDKVLFLYDPDIILSARVIDDNECAEPLRKLINPYDININISINNLSSAQFDDKIYVSSYGTYDIINSSGCAVRKYYDYRYPGTVPHSDDFLYLDWDMTDLYNHIAALEITYKGFCWDFNFTNKEVKVKNYFPSTNMACVIADDRPIDFIDISGVASIKATCQITTIKLNSVTRPAGLYVDVSEVVSKGLKPHIWIYDGDIPEEIKDDYRHTAVRIVGDTKDVELFARSRFNVLDICSNNLKAINAYQSEVRLKGKGYSKIVGVNSEIDAQYIKTLDGLYIEDSTIIIDYTYPLTIRYDFLDKPYSNNNYSIGGLIINKPTEVEQALSMLEELGIKDNRFISVNNKEYFNDNVYGIHLKGNYNITSLEHNHDRHITFIITNLYSADFNGYENYCNIVPSDTYMYFVGMKPDGDGFEQNNYYNQKTILDCCDVPRCSNLFDPNHKSSLYIRDVYIGSFIDDITEDITDSDVVESMDKHIYNNISNIINDSVVLDKFFYKHDGIYYDVYNLSAENICDTVNLNIPNINGVRKPFLFYVRNKNYKTCYNKDINIITNNPVTTRAKLIVNLCIKGQILYKESPNIEEGIYEITRLNTTKLRDFGRLHIGSVKLVQPGDINCYQVDCADFCHYKEDIPTINIKDYVPEDILVDGYENEYYYGDFVFDNEDILIDINKYPDLMKFIDDHDLREYGDEIGRLIRYIDQYGFDYGESKEKYIEGLKTNSYTRELFINMLSEIYNKNITFDDIKLRRKPTPTSYLFSCNIISEKPLCIGKSKNFLEVYSDTHNLNIKAPKIYISNRHYDKTMIKDSIVPFHKYGWDIDNDNYIGEINLETDSIHFRKHINMRELMPSPDLQPVVQTLMQPPLRLDEDGMEEEMTEEDKMLLSLEEPKMESLYYNLREMIYCNPKKINLDKLPEKYWQTIIFNEGKTSGSIKLKNQTKFPMLFFICGKLDINLDKIDINSCFNFKIPSKTIAFAFCKPLSKNGGYINNTSDKRIFDLPFDLYNVDIEGVDKVNCGDVYLHDVIYDKFNLETYENITSLDDIKVRGYEKYDSMIIIPAFNSNNEGMFVGENDKQCKPTILVDKNQKVLVPFNNYEIYKYNEDFFKKHNERIYNISIIKDMGLVKYFEDERDQRILADYYEKIKIPPHIGEIKLAKDLEPIFVFKYLVEKDTIIEHKSLIYNHNKDYTVLTNQFWGDIAKNFFNINKLTHIESFKDREFKELVPGNTKVIVIKN